MVLSPSGVVNGKHVKGKVVTLQVGQELWFVPRERRSGAPFITKVIKVGRKWAELDSRYRIDLTTLVADGGQYTSPGRCWLRKEDWEAAVRRSERWDYLRRLVDRQYRAPDGLATETIEHVIGLLTPKP